MTQDDIQRIIDEVPDLNDFGIGVLLQRRKTEDERKTELAEGKRELLNSVEACNRVCEWLGQIDKIKTINSHRSSYGLKHLAEKDIGYITNGVFIAAAIHCGYPYRIEPGDPNVCFGMSMKLIKAVMRRQNDKQNANWAI